MDIKEIEGRVWVVLISHDERKLADEKLLKISSTAPPTLSSMPTTTPMSEYFCDDAIDIKVEVVPIVEDMEFIINDDSQSCQPDPLDPLTIDFETPSTSNSNISQDYADPTPPNLLAPTPPKPKPKPYSCPICQSVEVTRAFAKPSQLRTHLNYHRRVGRAILTGAGTRKPVLLATNGIFTCHICNGRTFTVAKEFKNHRNFHGQLRKKYGQDRPIRMREKISPTSAIPIQDKYTCSYANCGKEFDDRTKFVAHLKFHRRKEREAKSASLNPRQRRSSIPYVDEYKCSKCNKVYPGKSRVAYRYHMKRHAELEMAEEKRKLRLERLRPDIPMQDSYFCEMCQRTFTDRLQYINHLRAHARLARSGGDRPIAMKKERNEQSDNEEEEDEQEFYCQTCDKTFYDRVKFKGHMAYHKQLQAQGRDRPIAPVSTSSWRSEIPYDLDSYTCTTCPSRSFSNRNSFISHMMIHRSLKRKGCDRPVLSKEEWSKENKKQSSCSSCSLDFESVKEFREHNKQFHPTLETSTRGRPDGAINWKDLVPEQDTPYTCDICPEREFLDRDAFIAHLKIHKSLERKGQDRVILSREQYKQQLKEKKIFPNSNSAPRTSCQFHCPTCSKNFWKRVTFRNHMRYHAILLKKGQGDRVIKDRQHSWKEDVPYLEEYVCDKCPDRRFTEREGYIKHLNYHRVLERKGIGGRQIKKRAKKEEFENLEKKCGICERVFQSWKTYRGHMAYHTRIKKTTGEDRKIEKKEEPKGIKLSSLKPGRSVNIVEDLIGVSEQFGCSCGLKLYFKDALLHHLQQAAKSGNTSCQELIIKREVPENEEIKEHSHENEERVKGFMEKLFEPTADDVKLNSELDEHQMQMEKYCPDAEDTCPENEMEDICPENEMEDICPENEMEDNCPENEMEQGCSENEMEEEFEHQEVLDDVENFEAELATAENDIKIDINKSQLNQQQPQENPEIGDDCVEDDGDDESMSFFYKCQTCEADSPSLTQYLRHQFLNHLLDQTAPLPCAFCAAQFVLGSKILLHCNEEHGEISSVTEFSIDCPSCGDTIQINSDRDEGAQFELHFKQRHPTMVCRMCGKLISNQTSLNKHIVTEHLKKKK